MYPLLGWIECERCAQTMRLHSFALSLCRCLSLSMRVASSSRFPLHSISCPFATKSWRAHCNVVKIVECYFVKPSGHTINVQKLSLSLSHPLCEREYVCVHFERLSLLPLSSSFSPSQMVICETGNSTKVLCVWLIKLHRRCQQRN